MWILIRKEVFENILTFRFALGFIACFLVFGLIFYVLMDDFLLDWEETQTAKREVEDTYTAWETYSYVRPTAIKERSLLAVFGDGMGRQWGKRVWISHTRVPVFTDDETSGGSRADLLGFYSSFDFTHVVQIFITLLALLFSFDAISGEKERGTLALLLSNPKKRTGLYIGKYVGSLLALVPIILAAFLLVLLLLLLRTPFPLGADEWISLLLMLLATVLLGAAFAALGMLISSLTQKTASSLIVSMIVWVLLVLLFPNAVGFLSSEFGFSEDSREFDRSLQALYEEHRGDLSLLGYLYQDYMVMANYSSDAEGQVRCRIMGDNAIAALMNLLPQAIEKQREFATQRYALESEYLASRAGKTALTANLLRLSPSSLYGNIVNALARTDAAAHADFMEQTRRYRDSVIEYIGNSGGYTSKRWFTSEVENAPHRAIIERMETMTQADARAMLREEGLFDQLIAYIQQVSNDPDRKLDLSGMPRFAMRQLPLAQAFATALFDVFLLVVFTAACLAVSFIRFSSYDPR